MVTLLVIVLVLVLLGGLPTWGYHTYGAYPSSIAAVLLVVLLVLFMMGRL